MIERSLWRRPSDATSVQLAIGLAQLCSLGFRCVRAVTRLCLRVQTRLAAAQLRWVQRAELAAGGELLP